MKRCLAFRKNLSATKKKSTVSFFKSSGEPFLIFDVHVFARFVACYAGAAFVRANGEISRTRARARARAV